MLESPHVAVGAAIATKVVHPALAIPLAFGSHFVLDRIPHWNPHTFTETQKHGRPTNKTSLFAFADSLFALVIGFYFAYRALPNTNLAILVVTASFFSVLPDVSKIPYYYFNVKKGLLKKWVILERTLQVETKNIALGLATQAALIAASAWWALS